MAAHRIYFGKGDQTLVTIPHQGGRPVRVTAGTYQIVDPRHGIDSAEHVIVAAGAVATVDATSTTLTAKAGRNAADFRALTLVSTAALVRGRQYLLQAASGQVELVKIHEVANGTLARTTQEIRGDYATGATLRGVEVSATFPAAPAEDDDNLDGEPFLIVWTFDGFPPLREAIHLERGEEAQLASLEDLKELDPLLARAGGDRLDPAAALSRAHKDLRTDLQLAGVPEADLLTGPVGRDAVTYRAAYLLTHHGDDQVARDKAAFYLARYNEIRAALVVGAKKSEVVALDKADQTAQRPNPARMFHGFGFAPGGV